MTTIAYKDGIVAYDSRLTRSGIIISDEVDKKIETDDYVFFLTGSCDEFEAFISLWRHGTPLEYLPDVRGFVFVKESKQLYYTGAWETKSGKYLPHKTLVKEPQAVEFAMRRDCNTGGAVNTFRLDPWQNAV